eukprot:6478400-Amphidinium_carterae.1
MAARVCDQGLEPYGDFALLTPYGRRMQKHLRYRSWLPQEDGSYKPFEAPGPMDFTTWSACWKVYSAVLLMLRLPDGSGGEIPVVRPQALDIYFEAFSRLVRECPETWHLCVQAEDRCRAECFSRIRRALGHAPQEGWDKVFERAAVDDRYWDREVRRPTLSFIARGPKGEQASHSGPQPHA